eukprot:901770_1
MALTQSNPNQYYSSLDVISCNQDKQRKSEESVIRLLSTCSVLHDCPISILRTIASYLPLQKHLIPYSFRTYSFDRFMITDSVFFVVHILTIVALLILLITATHIAIIGVTAVVILYEFATIIGCHCFYSLKRIYLNVDDKRTPLKLIQSGFASFYETFRNICAVNRIIVFSLLLYIVFYVQF